MYISPLLKYTALSKWPHTVTYTQNVILLAAFFKAVIETDLAFLKPKPKFFKI